MRLTANVCKGYIYIYKIYSKYSNIIICTQQDIRLSKVAMQTVLVNAPQKKKKTELKPIKPSSKILTLLNSVRQWIQSGPDLNDSKC